MAQEYDKKLDAFLALILNKIKMLEYQGCTCNMDKQKGYEELWVVLHDMYRYYDDMRQAVVVDKRPTFDNCLLPTMSVIERKLKRCVTSDLFPWLKHMFDEMNQLEDEGQSMYVNGIFA